MSVAAEAEPVPAEVKISGLNLDDDEPRLSAETLAALQEFLDEQATGASKDVSEDWELSQFWYDDVTATILAEECLQLAKNRIACISCPTVFAKLQELKQSDNLIHVHLFEFDRRFEKYGPDFWFYDYHKPCSFEGPVPTDYDVIILDPPFLARECLEEVVKTAKFLSNSREEAKIIICTGEIMTDAVQELFGAKKVQFRPSHARNLANEFVCFTNYDSVWLNE